MKPRVACLLLAVFVSTSGQPIRCAESKTPAPSASQLELVRQYARQRGGQPEALAQLIQLARGCDDAATVELIDELAASHYRAGNINLAAATRRAIVENYPNQPLARDSLLWLIRLYASSEVAHAHRAPSATEQALKRQLSPKMAAALKQLTTQADGDATNSPRKPRNEQAQYSLQLAAQAVAQNRSAGADPAIAFARAAAARAAGKDDAVAALLSPLKHRAPGKAWGDCARAEGWLADPRHEQPSKPIIHCLPATEPPHLDGNLNDAYWQTAFVDAAMDKPTAKAEQPPRVRWAYDQEHLYLAIECPKAAGVDYAPDNRPRPHDGNVQAHDRVELSLDLDRDYATAYQLTIDSRGWTADRVWEEAAWNPQWFVAAAQDAAHWTAEAAIPWAELVEVPPHAGEAWACAIKRALPNPNDPPPPLEPKSFALLIFD